MIALAAPLSLVNGTAHCDVTPVSGMPYTRGTFEGDEATAFAAKGARALAVVYGRLSLTGSDGARFSVSPGDDTVVLDGRFLVQVGARPVRLRIGSAILEARAAVLLVNTSDTGANVLVRSVAQSGGVRLVQPSSPFENRLQINAAYRATAEGLSLTATGRGVFQALYTALSAATNESRIPPQDPAGAADYRLGAEARKNDDAPDIEIEAVEIEIEPGCIEVCQD